jgi:predicted Zn-dependent protease
MKNREPASLRPSLVRTLFFVAIAVAALSVIDSVLARTERLETAAEAARFYGEGQRLLRQGKYAAAAEAFRSAIANARDNTEYPLALGQALLGAGQAEEAGTALAELLKADAMAGAPNLEMARVLAKQGQFEGAEFYYHRAIYGQWRQDANVNRVAARFELADLLARRNSAADLLAELLPLQDQAPADAGTRKKLARLYLTAGSPARAAAIFRDLVRAQPQDADSYEGLGDAEFARADYTAAQSAFITALRLNPDDRQARKGLELTDQVLNLDPLRRGLRGEERYERSVHVLDLVAARIPQCISPAQANEAAELIDAVNGALKQRVAASRQTDAVETNLDLANRLWQVERATCASAASPADQPLQLVLAKAAP